MLQMLSSSSSPRPPPSMWRRSQSANRGSVANAQARRPPGVLLGMRCGGTTRAATTRAHSSSNNNTASANANASTARRLLDAALLDPLHDLSVDFDRTYLMHRCGQSVPLFSDDRELAAGGGATAATASGNDATAAATNARLDRCLLLQREYGSALRRLLMVDGEQGGDRGSTPSEAALDAAVLLSAFVLSGDDDDDDEGDNAASSSPVALLQEARAAVDLLAERAIAISKGDRSARGLSAAVSEALFGGSGGDGSSASAATANGDNNRCFYDPSNSCALEVLRRVVARHDALSSTTDRQQHQSLGSPAALALVWSAVASKAGLPSAPLPLPSHTFVRLWVPVSSSDDGAASTPLPWVVDPYNSGQVCTAGVVSARLGRNWGVALEADGDDHQGVATTNGDDHHQHTLHALALVRLLCNLRESSWAPLPLTGRVRWAPVKSGDGGGSGSGGKRSSSSRRTLWPASSSSAAHDAVAARLAVRARKGWMGGGGGGGGPSSSPPPPALAPLSARCVRAVRLLRVTLREMVAAPPSDDKKQHLEAALPRLDRDEGYALCFGGMPLEGKEALRAYVERQPFASDAAAVREFL